jgi:cellulose synthase/poly-beta-1,6-N-acetylglucosamine synthase-like glycosyltransferase
MQPLKKTQNVPAHFRFLVFGCVLILLVTTRFPSLQKYDGHGNDFTHASSSTTSEIVKSAEATPATATTTTKVTFIIPSSLTRDTLNRTIESLQNQTRSDWKAIVGVDTIVANISSSSSLEDLSRLVLASTHHVIMDERVTFIPITTTSQNRGMKKNGAGGVRNEMIRSSHCQTDWVAFVDDDDTLSKYYLESLLSGQKQDPMADIFIFRMKHWKQGVLPPLRHGTVARKNNVGISFAVRRDLMVRSTPPPVVFTPYSGEDFVFLKRAQSSGARIKITNCIGYHVRAPPPPNEESFLRNDTYCHFENATIVRE